MRRRIIILGSTGSIGRQTLDVVRRHPERLQVVGVAAGRQVEELARQAREFGAHACVNDTAVVNQLRQLLEGSPGEACGGQDGLVQMAQLPEADLVVGAVSGVAGLAPVLAALECGKDVALANKEPLVSAGELVMGTANRLGARLLPIDSEISAVFQALKGEDRESVSKLILTASGGPFARLSKAELAQVTAERALDHPTWRMGPKVTIDSATLANKGFELFELHWMFDVPFDAIEVVVHHQSIIHSAVEFCDGSIIAQMGLPDMRTAIQYALFHPERQPNDLPRLNLGELGTMTFDRPDMDRFPCLRLAYDAGRAGQTYPAVLNGADEEAVDLFRAGRMGFLDIPRAIEDALQAHTPSPVATLADVTLADTWAREFVRHRFGAAQGR